MFFICCFSFVVFGFGFGFGFNRPDARNDLASDR